jgi:hypothetical protein
MTAGEDQISSVALEISGSTYLGGRRPRPARQLLICRRDSATPGKHAATGNIGVYLHVFYDKPGWNGIRDSREESQRRRFK